MENAAVPSRRRATSDHSKIGTQLPFLLLLLLFACCCQQQVSSFSASSATTAAASINESGILKVAFATGNEMKVCVSNKRVFLLQPTAACSRSELLLDAGESSPNAFDSSFFPHCDLLSNKFSTGPRTAADNRGTLLQWRFCW